MAVSDWTADSKAVLFESKRNGNPDIFKQDISQRDAETIVGTPEHETHPSLSPDRRLHPVRGVREALRACNALDADSSWRRTSGTSTQRREDQEFSCAREANVCVVVEEVEGKQILTKFDPLKGRGDKLPFSDYPESRTILSPQGRLVEKMKSGPEGLYVRVRSLTGGLLKK